MGTAVGIGIVVAILVLLPLGAVWLAGRWRDPPPERWGLTLPDGGDEPGMVEYRLRKRYGLRDEHAWAAVRRAAVRGEAAPEELRPPTAEYAALRLRALEDQLRRTSPLLVNLLLVAAAAALLVAVTTGREIAGFYAAYLVGVAVMRNPALLRRQAARARAAVEANRG